MKYIILVVTLLLLTSCTTKPVEKPKPPVTITESPSYRFVNVELKDFPFKTYNSGTIISINKLEVRERYLRKSKLNLETMEMEYEPVYSTSSACDMAECPRYRIRVEYDMKSGDHPYSITRDEFVAYIEPRGLPPELIDDTDSYKNIP